MPAGMTGSGSADLRNTFGSDWIRIRNPAWNIFAVIMVPDGGRAQTLIPPAPYRKSRLTYKAAWQQQAHRYCIP